MAAVVLAAAAAVSALRVPREMRTVFSYAPPDVTPPELRAQVARAEALLPPGAPVFFVTADSDSWRCGIWQRLMYPRLVFCLLTGLGDPRPQAAALAQRFAVRHAIVMGPPPPDLAFVRRRAIPGEHQPVEVAEMRR
jgi:hypothetical protein